MDRAPESERLGESLVKQDVITQEEYEEAREREEKSGIPLYRQFLQMGKVSAGVLEDLLRTEFHSKSRKEQHQNLGYTLREMNAISAEQLNEALALQKRNGRLLGKILLDRGIIDHRTMAQALANQYDMEYAELEVTPSQPEALAAVPENVARKHELIPVTLEGDRLTVLVGHPQKKSTLINVGVLLGRRIHAVMTNADNIRDVIRNRYSGLSDQHAPPQPAHEVALPEAPKESKSPAKPKETTPKTKSEKENPVASQEEPAVKKPDSARFENIARQASGVPVIKLVSTIIEGAVNAGATDIHLDPQDPEMRVRYRIDGILHDVMSISADIESAVISRVKILAEMDITETRHPQDGHISTELGGTEYDIRVATLPTFLGERVVLRLLDQSSVLAGIKDLGLESEDEDKLRRLVAQPYGMILVTGPTGSGKTTTLYAALNQKNVMTESIVTLEDPVEYQLNGINQVSIDTDIELTFANTLRAAMRQDIDVLLVGEIRDAETARIAIRAAMTGHLVFSTLHTNDAPEAISTLRNMGIPSFLIESALTSVVGQRLIRKICEDCKKEFKPTKPLLKSVGLPESVKKLWRGAGCDVCYHSGNKGRTGIFEILEISPKVRELITQEVSPNEIAKAVKLKTMAERCRNKVREGVSDPEEFLRVIRT